MSPIKFHRQVLFLAALAGILPSAATAQTVPYSHGNPTAEEQYLLELVNRARANPAAEGLFLADSRDPTSEFAIGYFKVNLARLKSDFASYAPRPPLAFNPALLVSSKRQSRDMAIHNFQDHTGSDGSTLGSRAADAGIATSALGENIYSSLVPTILFAHVGLNTDWGFGEFGVQTGVGHRQNIMGTGVVDFREIGIGIVLRSGADAVKFGKLSVTQDFGTRFGSPSLLVGVAYYDVNLNGICDPGEGLPGIRVQPATGSFHAITSTSGGYAIPFSVAPGISSVVFSGGGLKAPITMGFTMSGENVKTDLRITSGGAFVALKPLDSIASERGKVAEGDASFRIARVGPIGNSLEVGIETSILGGLGVASPDDYKLTAVSPAKIKTIAAGNFTVTLAPNQSFADIQLKAVADLKIEPVENARFVIRSSTAYSSDTTRSIVISIRQ